MSLTITKRPALFTAALVPVVYRMQRKDQAFNTITNNGGTIRITVNSVNVSANYNVGDQVYVKSDDSKYDAIGTVTAKAFSTNTTIDVNIAYTANATTGFVNNNTTRPLYQVLVNVYKSVTNALLFTKGFVFTADSKGSVIADIQFIKQVLDPEITTIGNYGVATQDAKKFVDFYIGTTEQWFGSANSETSDSANVRTSIFGILPIGGNNDYPFRIPGKSLSIASKVRAFIGKYFDLSYYGLTSNNKISVEHYASDGTLTSTDADVTAVAGVCRVPILPLSTDRKIIAKNIQGNVIPAGTSWLDVSGANAMTKATSTLSAAISATGIWRARTPIPGVDLNNFTSLNFTLTITGTWTGSITLEARLTNKLNYVRSQMTAAQTGNGATPITLSTSSNLFTFGGIYPETLLVYIGATITSGTANVAVTIPNGQVINTIIAAQEIEVRDACVKPITLSWTNRLGGQDWWTFLFNQEVNYDYGNNKKSRRLFLHANDLSYEQWQMLSGMFDVGEIYNKSFTELTSSVMGTEKRIGSQVYLLRDNFGLLEVVAIPTTNNTETKKNSHTFDAMIELPDGYEDNDFFLSYSGKTKRFISTLTSSNPNNQWEVRWFGAIIQSMTPGTLYTQVLQLPTEPIDLVVVIRKLTNNGVAETGGSISWAKDGGSYPALAMSFNAGDDVSELTFVMTNVDATAVNPNDRINVTVTE